MLSVVPSVDSTVFKSVSQTAANESAPQILTKQQLNVPGILGGLGPLAHIEFEKRLLHNSVRQGACRDQDHPDWVLISAASTPDRTQRLLNKGEDCVPSLIRSARVLEMMGADFMVVTCNTAHAFYQMVQPQINLPWLHMMDITARHIAHHYPHVRRVGILATDGTVRSRLYTNSLSLYELESISPCLNSSLQERVMSSIYAPHWGIKASGDQLSDRALAELTTTIHGLKQQGADLVIAGCTELSVGLRAMNSVPMEWIDPLDIMAEITLDFAYNNCLTSPSIAV